MNRKSITIDTPRCKGTTMNHFDEDECMKVLRDPKGFLRFRDYLKVVVACEILDFWMEVELLRNGNHHATTISPSTQSEEKVFRAVYIYHKYCRASST